MQARRQALPARTSHGGKAPRTGIKMVHTPDDKVSKKTERKKRRFRPGVRALMDIKKYQKSTDLLLQKIPFVRLVREIAQDVGHADVRFTRGALGALQVITEDVAIEYFNKLQMQAIHAKRVKITVKDSRLALCMWNQPAMQNAKDQLTFFNRCVIPTKEPDQVDEQEEEE